MTIATQRATAGVIEELFIGVPINRRVISHSAILVPPEQRTCAQKVAASTYGQVFGGTVSILSLGKMLFDFAFKRDGSILDKYLIPILGAFTGIVLSLNSTKQESGIADNHANEINQNKNSANPDNCPDSHHDYLLTFGQSAQPRIAIHEGNNNDPVDELTAELEQSVSLTTPELRCVVLDDGTVHKTSDEILLDRVYEELGFNFKKILNDENERTLYLKYWFAIAYLKHNSKRDGDQYSRAIKLIDEIILSNDMSEKVLEARQSGSIRLTSTGVALHQENLNLGTFRRIFDINVDSLNFVRRKTQKILQLISLLTPDQKDKLETLFYRKYFPQAATAAK